MAAERSGGGDPARTLALLWRRPPEPKPVGRKPKVSVDQIVAAAIAVADREGLGAMSMARVQSGERATSANAGSNGPSCAENFLSSIERGGTPAHWIGAICGASSHT
jgi:hypothetical protein